MTNAQAFVLSNCLKRNIRLINEQYYSLQRIFLIENVRVRNEKHSFRLTKCVILNARQLKR